MENGQEFTMEQAPAARLLLGIDTCGPSGSVALGRLGRDNGIEAIEILGQIELEGRSYSATLVAAVGRLLGEQGVALRDLHAIAAVNGPGSFTGVRVGLSAVKGLAEGGGVRVVAVSRLEVLAAKAGLWWAALDAHRSEVFLRVGGPERTAREMLAGVAELAQFDPAGAQITVCDESAALLLESVWPGVELVRAGPPTAADALRVCAARVAEGEFIDVALLDGHYLRRSDAEIFGEAAGAGKQMP